MKYLKNFNQKLVNDNESDFRNGVMIDREQYIRETERYQTIQDFINLEHEDMEAFYDQTSVGEMRSKTD
jgi:hypothetical protein